MVSRQRKKLKLDRKECRGDTSRVYELPMAKQGTKDLKHLCAKAVGHFSTLLHQWYNFPPGPMSYLRYILLSPFLENHPPSILLLRPIQDAYLKPSSIFSRFTQDAIEKGCDAFGQYETYHSLVTQTEMFVKGSPVWEASKVLIQAQEKYGNAINIAQKLGRRLVMKEKRSTRPCEIHSKEEGLKIFAEYYRSLLPYIEDVPPDEPEFGFQKQVLRDAHFYLPIRNKATVLKRLLLIFTTENLKKRKYMWLLLMYRNVWTSSKWIFDPASDIEQFDTAQDYLDACESGKVPEEAYNTQSAYGAYNIHRSNDVAMPYWNALARWETMEETVNGTWRVDTLFEFLQSKSDVAQEVERVIQARNAAKKRRQARKRKVKKGQPVSDEETDDEDTPIPNIKRRNEKRFHGFGGLTTFLVVGDLFSAGFTEDEHEDVLVEKVAVLMNKVARGSFSGMQELGILARTADSTDEKVIEAYRFVYYGMKELLTEEERTKIGFNVFVPEHGLCKWQRSEIESIPNWWIEPAMISMFVEGEMGGEEEGDQDYDMNVDEDQD